MFNVTVLKVEAVRAIPQTEAVLVAEVLALAMVRSWIVLLVIVFVPFTDAMPLISPAVPFVVLVVPFCRLAMVLPFILTVPVPAL